MIIAGRRVVSVCLSVCSLYSEVLVCGVGAGFALSCIPRAVGSQSRPGRLLSIAAWRPISILTKVIPSDWSREFDGEGRGVVGHDARVVVVDVVVGGGGGGGAGGERAVFDVVSRGCSSTRSHKCIGCTIELG